jgi:hypothetical protein
VCFGWLNVKSVLAEKHFKQAELWNNHSPLQTFAAVNEAYKTMPFEGRYRIQLLLSLGGLLASNDKARVQPDAADKAYRYAASASPHQPAVLISRAQYLINSGRWKENGELAHIAGVLERSARKHHQAWMIVAFHYALVGQNDKASAALIEGLEAGGPEADMQRVANMLNMEITEQ